MTGGGQEMATLVMALLENSQRLGLTWSIRFGTVQSVKSGLTFVTLDGSDSNNPASALPAVPLGAQPAPKMRVTCLLTSPTDVYVIGSNLEAGQPVMRWRSTGTTNIVSGGTGTFMSWDTNDLDFFKLFSTGITNFTPTIPGWYLFNCKSVWASNATGARGTFVNLNGTTGGATGNVGGGQVAAASGANTEVGGSGLAYMNGTTDFAGVRLVQNSGGTIGTGGTTDGGNLFEATYLGSPRTS